MTFDKDPKDLKEPPPAQGWEEVAAGTKVLGLEKASEDEGE